MERRLVKFGEAAVMLGCSVATLRRWDASGELVPARRTQKGTRCYNVADLLGVTDESVPTVCYVRVSSGDQKADLECQHVALEAFCAAKGWRAVVVKDLGSGVKCHKRGLQQFLEMILRRRMDRLVLTHKDRLLRFGSELVFVLCEAQGIEVVIIDQGERPSFEEELAQDVLEIITVFSARLYGARSHESKKLIDALTDAVITDQATKLAVL
ncbi:MAG: IS607 family transposase [Acidimicrobiaceae bacterium]|nr:IS607 family transposase [Acidimicrobiaceae bacterium]